jgi:hypothetical protein
LRPWLRGTLGRPCLLAVPSKAVDEYDAITESCKRWLLVDYKDRPNLLDYTILSIKEKFDTRRKALSCSCKLSRRYNYRTLPPPEPTQHG